MPLTPLDRLLSGDFSVMDDQTLREEAELAFTAFDWEYALLDLDGDGQKELFLRGQGSPFYLIFHEQDGELEYWDGDLTGRADKRRTLLTDGAMVLEDLYPGCAVDDNYYRYDFCYTFSRYGSDGQCSEVGHLYGQWDTNAGAGHNGLPSPGEGQWNDIPLTKAEYEAYYQREIQEKELKDWTPVNFEKEESE